MQFLMNMSRTLSLFFKFGENIALSALRPSYRPLGPWPYQASAGFMDINIGVGVVVSHSCFQLKDLF